MDVLAANTYPGDFATGRKGTTKSGVTVYTGPSSANYVTAGSLSSGESFTYLTYNPAATMQFVEYSTASGTKRGYIFTSDATAAANTVLAKAKGNITTFATPGGTASGSLQEEEYCVILAKTTYFYLVEYNTRNGRKTAYANKQDLTVIGDASNVADDSGISSNAAMSVSSTVYGGPSTKIYASIGSVSAGEEVNVICREGSFYYIRYYTATSYKCGYVPVSTVTGEENIQGRLYSSANAFRMTTAAATVYSASSSASATIGSVFANEGVTCLGHTEGMYTFVEYSTSSGTKRGFVETSVLTAPVSSVLGKCGADTNVYYVPGQTRIGSVYADEYVCVLSQDTAGGVYYIEYNSASGRKRGYAAIGNITLAGGTVSEVSSGVTGHELKSSTVGQAVYSGPSTAYAEIGTITQYETVYDLGTESGYTYIQYNISGGYKRGYIPANTLTDYSEATVKESDLIFKNDIAGAQLGVLGKSGEGRIINYYMIGDQNATKKMVLNFAIHGHEDAANQIEHDGYELTKLAIKLTHRLGERVEAGDDLNGWLVYVIPALNPDGILYTHPDSEKHVPNARGYADCSGMGRHSTMEFEWEWEKSDGDSKIIDIEQDTAPVEGGHIDMNRCFLYKDENGVWTFVGYTNAGRNYTGPSPMRAKEALYIHHFLRSIAQEELEKKIFIDTHGWTKQIITNDEDIYNAFKEEFDDYGDRTDLGGAGYVARYAQDLGFKSCLFEFPVMTSDNLGTEHYNFDFIENHGWDEDYITVIENLIDSDND